MPKLHDQSIYQASYSEIFFKNFLAGLGRGFGGIFILFILTLVVYKLLWPQLSTQIEHLTNLVNNLQSNSIVKNTPLPKDLNQLFNQYVQQ